MKRWLVRGLVGLVVLVLAAGAALWAGQRLAVQRAERQIEVAVTAPAPLGTASDAAALQRGHYFYSSRGCADCHGADGAGKVFVDSGGIKLAGPNISPGAGSVVTGYRPEDWVRTLRHGIKPGGRPVRVMPSEDYNQLTDADLAAIVGYVRSLPPAPGGGPLLQLPLLAQVAYGYGLIGDAASKIDHTRWPPAPVPEGVTPEHGRYVAQMCIGCHGAKLEGGRIPGGPPDWPAASRLAPGEGSVMARYADAESMLRMFKTGRRADGSAVMVMPFEALAQINDTDGRALHLYLTSTKTPARP